MHSDVYFNGEQVRSEGPDPDFPPRTCSVCGETKHAWISLPDGIQHFRQARV
jgi:hypothetical protein